MRFHAHLLPIYVPETDPPFGPYLNQVLEQVTLAEELGWECQWFTEHHFVQYGGPIPNPAVMLAAAAARTSRIRLGSAISILPLHHPVQTAEDYAMVDALSGGRLEFGIGRGNTELDYTASIAPKATPGLMRRLQSFARPGARSGSATMAASGRSTTVRSRRAPSSRRRVACRRSGSRRSAPRPSAGRAPTAST